MEQLAIANRHAAIKGMPKIKAIDAKRVTAAILAMRGVNQSKQKQTHQEGNLKLHRRPLAYKGLSRAWLRHFSIAKEDDDWTKEPKHEEEPDVAPIPLNQVKCPKCGHNQDTANNKMRAKVGFGQLTCQRCRQVTKAYTWYCECGVEWHRCKMHAHKDILRGVSLRAETVKRGLGDTSSARGVSDSVPKRARTEWHEVAIPESSPVCQRISLDYFLYPKLAEKFPHYASRDYTIVEAAIPT